MAAPGFGPADLPSLHHSTRPPPPSTERRYTRYLDSLSPGYHLTAAPYPTPHEPPRELPLVPAPKRQRLSTTSLPPSSAVQDARRPSVADSYPSFATASRESVKLEPNTAPVLDAPVRPPEPGARPFFVPVKSRRVRTGCLTCRERHLKCDEATPECLNCRKSNRECKRGVRLNFIDITVKTPPYLLPVSRGTVTTFEDESREIASEYRGGIARYKPYAQEPDGIDEGRRKSLGASAPSAVANGTPRVTQPPQHPPPGREDPQTRASIDATAHAQTRPGNSTSQFVTSLDAELTDASRLRLPAVVGERASERGPGTGNEDDGRINEGRSSDTSSLASSMIPQGVGAPSNASVPGGPAPAQADPVDRPLTPTMDRGPTGDRRLLGSPEEIHYMQVFVEEVGVWMDCLDKEKHFSRIIPYLALRSPMLLDAFLACGVKHLVNRTHCTDDKALFYYDTATTQLLRSLQNPDRNIDECATTAVVLNVYEIMSEKPTQRMNHIAGARALIRECGWNASSKGVGAACFWLNIGMEVLSCLAYNWATAWDPDDWGLDLSYLNNIGKPGGSKPDAVKTDGDVGATQSFFGGGGAEEVWVHRIFYVVAKIANFRANTPKFQEPSPHDEQIRRQNRFKEWQRLRDLCDAWNDQSPRSMRPFGYVHSPDTASQSAFPQVWLIRRTAVIGRLYYHTAMILLHQINPLEPAFAPENVKAQLHHAHQVCGIVAHTKDRGVASVAIRSIAIAACVLTDRREQTEVVGILDKIKENTCWDISKVHKEMNKAWGLDKPAGLPPVTAAPMSGPLVMPSTTTSTSTLQSFLSSAPALPPHLPHVTGSTAVLPVVPPTPHRPKVNPLLVQADFSLPNHPYQNWYRPPNQANPYSSQGFYTGS